MAFESIFEDDQITSRIRPFSLERKCQPKLRMASDHKLGKILNPLLWRIKVCVHGMKGLARSPQSQKTPRIKKR